MRSKRLAIIALVIILGGCHRRAGVSVALPPPAVVPVVVPVAVAVPIALDIPATLPPAAGTGLFEQAELAFGMADYDTAIHDYENYLQSIPNGDRIDQVLFHLGMSYVLRTKPPANWTRARTNLGRLVNEHPDSPLKPTATLILSLRSRADKLAGDAKTRDEIVQQLNAELARLKKIDADRRKHP